MTKNMKLLLDGRVFTVVIVLVTFSKLFSSFSSVWYIGLVWYLARILLSGEDPYDAMGFLITLLCGGLIITSTLMYFFG